MADGRRTENGGTISSHGNTCISETTVVMIEVFSVANRPARAQKIHQRKLRMHENTGEYERERENNLESEKYTSYRTAQQKKNRDSWYNVVWLLSHPSLP